MKKVLMVASVASMIDLFNMNNIQILQDLGYTVEVACNFQNGSITSSNRVNKFKEELEEKNIKYYDIPIPRNITKLKDIYISYSILKNIINENRYKLIHCHSPIGGVIARISAAKYRHKGLKVIYTAHGFHFFKGASKEKWFIYYPIERYLSKITDCIITINEEDYNISRSKMKTKRVEYVPGIGIDVDKISSVPKSDYHGKFNLISIGQLSHRKNHRLVIESLALLKTRINIDDIQYLICGLGELENQLKDLANKLKVSENIVFLGFQENVVKYLKQADCFVFPSYQEGLPVSLMEAMAVPLPVICSNVRGNTDLIDDNKGGILIDPDDTEGMARAIELIVKDRSLREKYEEYNLDKVKKYDTSIVNQNMKEIYKTIIEER